MENQVSEIIQGSQPENDVADNFKLVIRGDQKKNMDSERVEYNRRCYSKTN